MSLHLLHYLKHNNLQDNQPLPLGFEKNYPKNIFIPVVEFLTSLGLKQHYEMCVGTREYYETKNVVSLSVLFKLISQPWFKHNVDKTQLLRVVSNKLLVNSKIKKKAFHLKMAELILNSTYVDERDFKHQISRNMNLIAQTSYLTHDVLAFSNATLFLMSSLLTTLTKTLGSKPLFQDYDRHVRQNKIFDQFSEESQNSKNNLTSKQQYRQYIKELIKMYNYEHFSISQLEECHQEFKEFVRQSEEEFRQKYHLMEGIPNWKPFAQLVSQRCLKCKQTGEKLTNNLLNLWIDDFKQSSIKIESYTKKPKGQQNIFLPSQWHNIGNSSLNELLYKTFYYFLSQGQNQTPKEFEPIVLQSENHSSNLLFDCGGQLWSKS